MVAAIVTLNALSCHLCARAPFSLFRCEDLCIGKINVYKKDTGNRVVFRI